MNERQKFRLKQTVTKVLNWVIAISVVVAVVFMLFAQLSQTQRLVDLDETVNELNNALEGIEIDYIIGD